MNTLYWVLIALVAVGIIWYLMANKNKKPEMPEKPQEPQEPTPPPENPTV
jgi:flagellar basal body-associated protein FliL